MKSSISIILGDVHLGASISLGRPGIGSSLNSRIIDQFELLEWVLDQAISRGVENLILTGDVFDDPKPHPTLIALFIQWLQKCIEANIEVHIIVGNHDLIRSGNFKSSALDIVAISNLDGVFVYHNISTIHTRGASFTLVPFRDRRSFTTTSNIEAIQLLSAKLPYELGDIDPNQIKVMVGHLAIEGSIPIGNEIDDFANELMCPLDMFTGFDFTWMGHIHRPQVFSTEPYIAHIGSMDLTNFGETDHTKIIVVFDPNKDIPFEYVELPVRPLKQISISVPDDITNTTDYIVKQLQFETQLSRSIVKLNVALNNPTAPSVDRKIIERHLLDLGAFHIAKINEEKKVLLVKKDVNDNLSGTMTELAAVKMYAETNIRNDKQIDFISLASSIVSEYKTEIVK